MQKRKSQVGGVGSREGQFEGIPPIKQGQLGRESRIQPVEDIESPIEELSAGAREEQHRRKFLEFLGVKPSHSRLRVLSDETGAVGDVNRLKAEQLAGEARQLSLEGRSLSKAGADVSVVVNKYRGADELYGDALKLDSKVPKIWHNRGVNLLRLWDHTDESDCLGRAKDCFGEALKLEPNHPNSNFCQGYTFELLGDEKKAVRCYSAEIERDPTHTKANDRYKKLTGCNFAEPPPIPDRSEVERLNEFTTQRRGDECRNCGDVEGAKRLWSRAVEGYSVKSDWEGVVGVGDRFERVGDVVAAKRLWSESAEAFSVKSDWGGVVGVGDRFEDVGDRATAKKLWSRAVGGYSVKSDWGGVVGVGDRFERVGDVESAKKWWSRAINVAVVYNSHNFEVLAHTGSVAADKLGDQTRAADLWGRAVDVAEKGIHNIEECEKAATIAEDKLKDEELAKRLRERADYWRDNWDNWDNWDNHDYHWFDWDNSDHHWDNRSDERFDPCEA
ncbi:MAG: hypothetical protein V1921_02010 [Candidatus Altiarchaeota archaeon]